MLKRTTTLYLDAFRGLSREIWWLALVTFINRAGTMVLPFLSKYLKEDLNFSYGQVGWIMAFFGVGSLLGSWLGGRLTDKIGFYKVMVWSLLISGILFILLQFIHSFWGLCIGILLIMSVADMFRPAMFVSLSNYSKPETRTRSLTLIRLAINLGFVIGPTMAGIIIISSGYNMLFWIDGLTCILSIGLFTQLVKEIKSPSTTKTEITILDRKAAVFKDKPYWILLTIIFLIGVIFFQIFTTMPLYHKEQYNLTEFHTGLLFFLNGFIIVLFEMPLIHWIEKRKIEDSKLILISAVLVTVSFLILFYKAWAGVLIISMILITIGEMIGFPYTNALAMKRAKSGNEGRYMALYSMAFGFSHVISPKLGLDVVAKFGYSANFGLISFIGVLAMILTFWLRNEIRKEA